MSRDAAAWRWNKRKETFKQIISEANVVQFKNDWRDLGPKYVHTIVGGTSPPVPNETRCCQRDGHNSKTAEYPRNHQERAQTRHQQLDPGCDSSDVFQLPMMDVLDRLGATIYIGNVFIADETEEEHL